MKLNLKTCADVRRRSGFTLSCARSASSCGLRAKKFFKVAFGLFGLAGVLGFSSGTPEINNEPGPVLQPVRSLHLLDLPALRGSPSVGTERKQFVFVPAQDGVFVPSGFQLLSLAPEFTRSILTDPPLSILEISESSSDDQSVLLLRPSHSLHLLDLQPRLNSDSPGK